MQRRKLMDAIADYGLRHPNESAVIERLNGLLDDHPRCFHNDCWAGHITGSAWVLHPDRHSVLLTHHRKLNMWLQLGGHSDGDEDTWRVATREAEEESGLNVRLADEAILDLDVHDIPARKGDPVHAHFDVRFVFLAQGTDFTVTEESNALAWVPMSRLTEYTTEVSVTRLVDKSENWAKV